VDPDWIKIHGNTRPSVGHNSKDTWIGFFNIDVNEFPRELATVKDGVIQSIMVGNVSHEISMRFTCFDRSNLIKGENTVCPRTLVRTNELGNSFRFVSIQYDPRLRQRIGRGGASYQNLKPFCCGVASVDNWYTKSDALTTAWVDQIIRTWSIEEYKSALTYNIVVPNQVRLPDLDTGIGQYGEEGKQAYYIRWILPVAIFIVSIVGFYHCMPRRDALGYCVKVICGLLWISATILVLSIILPAYAGSASQRTALPISFPAAANRMYHRGVYSNQILLPI
jgi:hypothetical protein